MASLFSAQCCHQCFNYRSGGDTDQTGLQVAIKYADVPKLFFALSLETVSDAGEQYSVLALSR